MSINGFVARVRCICGRVMLVDTPVICSCGVNLDVRKAKGDYRVRAWAVAPDGYDLSHLKFSRPEIVGWKDTEENQ